MERCAEAKSIQRQEFIGQPEKKHPYIFICDHTRRHTYSHTHNRHSVSFEDVERLPLVQRPATHRSVGGRRQQDPVVSVRTEARDRSTVPPELGDDASALERPRPCGAVRRSGHDQVANLRRRRWPISDVAASVTIAVAAVIRIVARQVQKRKDAGRVTEERANAFAVVEVPDSDGAIRRAAEDEVAGADEPIDTIRMSFEH